METLRNPKTTKTWVNQVIEVTIHNTWGAAAKSIAWIYTSISVIAVAAVIMSVHFFSYKAGLVTAVIMFCLIPCSLWLLSRYMHLQSLKSNTNWKQFSDSFRPPSPEENPQEGDD